jgi:hypothetical protein
MLTGLGRFSAVVWTLVGLLVFWLLTGAAFSGPALPAGETFKAWVFIVLAMGACYLLHRATCWLFGAAARKPRGLGH